MKLAEKIELFKKNNPDRLEHTFKNSLKFKGFEKYRLHYWIDSLYKDAVNEWIEKKCTDTANFLEKILA